MKAKMVDTLTHIDKQILPVYRKSRFVSDGEVPPTLTEYHDVMTRDGVSICVCNDKKYAEYVVNSLNMVHYSKKTNIMREGMKDHVIGTIIIQGEVIPKDDKRFPYVDDSSLIKYRRNFDYQRYIGKFKASQAKLWTLKDDEVLEDAEIYLVIFFYVDGRFVGNIGDCIATVVDGLITSGIVNASRRTRVNAIAKSAFVRCKDGHRTEIYLMRYRKKNG